MLKINLQLLVQTIGVCILICLCSHSAKAQYPHTDPDNNGNWILREDISDEFDAGTLNHAKWQVCGKDGTYWGKNANRPGFTGRGYGPDSYNTGWEFSPENLSVENGLLKIRTRFQPDYPWVNNPNNWNFKYTTGGMWSKATISQGYMEVRCKLHDGATTTGAFWTTGSAEIDVFEATGKHATKSDEHWSSLHDWSIPLPNVSWTNTTKLPFHFGDGFHTFSAEWNDDSLRIYADGKFIHGTTKKWVEANGPESKKWPFPGNLHVWVDSEIFPWWGKPTESQLESSYYQVDYVRVWEKGPVAVTGVTISNPSQKRIFVYQNPHKEGELKISLPRPISVSVLIYDSQGTMIYSGEYTGTSEVMINYSQLKFTKGLYIIKVHGADLSTIQKVVINQ